MKQVFHARCAAALLLAGAVMLAGCGSEPPAPASPAARPMSASEGRALIARLLPADVKERNGWAADIYAAIATLEIAPTVEHFCAAIAVIGQESSFQADPVVPGLAGIVKKELERRRAAAGIPSLALEAALALPSTNGRSYGERLAAVRTERQLSDIYEDFIGRVPLGRTFLSGHNPVRTGGPMQVSIAFAESQIGERPYPYPQPGSVRDEVFSRRGGVYFGIAHLLAYPADYPQMQYRFADFNAGQYASRNAAFQRAVSELSGVPLALDGDLLRYEDGSPSDEPGSTERALRTIARRLDLGEAAIRRDLRAEKSAEFARTRLYTRVYELAGELGRPAPRAVLPQIPLNSPKITRPLTSEWFAGRVDARHQACLKRAG